MRSNHSKVSVGVAHVKILPYLKGKQNFTMGVNS